MRAPSIGQHIVSVLLLPFMVTVVIPYLLTRENLPAKILAGLSAVRVVFGGLFIVVGLSLVVATVALFGRMGKGTLAPWNPTQRLVVAGPYRYVRNPMISGVASILLGEALCMYSVVLFGWFLLFLAINHVYFILSEEPGLVRRFGAAYEEYRRHVPRWIPRLTPWRTEP